MRSQRRLVSPLSAFNLSPNTFIGGVASTIPTKAALATKLVIAESSIPYFAVVGSDVEAAINVDYNLPSFQGNTDITYYFDDGGKVISLIADGFRFATKLNDIWFPAVTYLPSYCFHNTILGRAYFPAVTSMSGYGVFLGISTITTIILPEITSILNGSSDSSFQENPRTVYIPKCTALGNSLLFDYVFYNIKIGVNIYTDQSLSTINSGSMEGDLAYARDNRSANIFYTTLPDILTKPNAITNLSIGTKYATVLQLNFTPPSSVNGIDYYEVYVNGVYNKNIVSGDYITGLNPDTTYTITVKAVDIYYNKSGFSNSVSDTTKSEAQFQTETISYKNRVLADGGIVQNIGAVDTRIQRLKELSLYSSLFHANSDKGGFKIDASNLIEKAYSYPDATTDLVQITSTRKPTLINDGLLFDSVDDELSKTLTSNSLSSFSVIWKIKPTTGNYFPLFSFGAWESFNLHSENGGKIYAGITIGARFAIAEAMLNNVLATYTFTYDQPSGIAKLYRNETLLGSKSMPAPVALSKLQMSNVGGSHYELIVLTKAISLTELQNVLKL